MLNQIGLKAKPRIVDGDVYFQTIGNQETKAADGLRQLVPGLPAPVQLHVPDRRERRSSPRTTRTSATSTTRRSTPCSPRPTRSRHQRGGAPSTPTVDKQLVTNGDIVPYGQPHAAVHHVEPDGLRQSAAVPPGAAATMYSTFAPQGLATLTEREGHAPRCPSRSAGRLIISSKARGVSGDHRSAAPSTHPTQRPRRGARLHRGRADPRARPVAARAGAGCGATDRARVRRAVPGAHRRRLLAPRVREARRAHDAGAPTTSPTRSRSAARRSTSSRSTACRSARRGTASFFLGADRNGRDVAVRLLYGGRNSLEIGFVATLITMFLATSSALLAGYFRGVDRRRRLARVLDVLWAFPVVLLGVALGVALALGGLNSGRSRSRATRCWIPRSSSASSTSRTWPSRSAGRCSALREREFVDAARAAGRRARCGSCSARCCRTSSRRSSSSSR